MSSIEKETLVALNFLWNKTPRWSATLEIYGVKTASTFGGVL